MLVLVMMFEALVQQPNMMAAVWRRFGVYLFEGPVTLDDMARMESHGAHWFRKNPGKIVEMVIIYPSESRMNSEERARMGKVIKRWEDQRLASATVILATDLVGSMQRSVLTGLQLIVRPPHPTKVFGTTADALTWLAPYVTELCGVDATYAAVMEGVEELRARFAARPAKGA
jgi:hypothetical protein